MVDVTDAEVAAARAYEGLHVRAIFEEWAQPVLDAAAVGPGSRVLDVACGTGVVARTAFRRVGPTGAVTGLDISPGMLAVAGDIEPGVTWRIGDAGALPFDDGQFDAVVNQFGLMFVPDRVTAVREMLRCAAPDGRVVVAVWDALERSAAYPDAVALLDRRAGPAAADALRAPFVLGDPEGLRVMFEQAGASQVSVDTRTGTARFPSVRAMAEADLRGWLPVMGVELDEELVQSILEEAEHVLGEHVADDGAMVFDAPAHVVTAHP